MNTTKQDHTDTAGNVSDCSKCHYSWRTIWGRNENPIWACDYIGIENKHRPCKAGPGCTVFKPKKSRKKHTAGWFNERRRDE